jgi:ectoine hydroxylase-related dioxygenase (phytanoyl-CoA dioxygenase family)
MAELAPALSSAQVASFHEQGYLVDEVLFDAEEIGALGAAYSDCLQHMAVEGKLKSIRSGQLDDGTTTQVFQIRAAHLQHALFAALIRDARILDRVQCLLGPDLKVILCQGLHKPPHTGGEVHWHQDDYYFRVSGDRPVVSCWFAFDAATADSGCMRVLPGHHDRLREHKAVGSAGYVMIGADESRELALELAPGQVMFHHGATPHRTLANSTDCQRRAMAIHFMDAKARPLGDGREAEPAENMPVVRGVAHDAPSE